MKGDACTYILTPESLFEVVSKVEFFLFVCLFLTAIRKTKKTLYLSAGHTYNISVSHIDFSNTQLRRRTSKYAKPPENKWHNSSHQHKNSPAVSPNQFSHLSTYSSSHFSLHPPISPSTPLQSLQSAVSYRIPLQPSDAALQKKQRCTSVCSTHVQYSVSERHLFIFCYVQQKSSADTQH